MTPKALRRRVLRVLTLVTMAWVAAQLIAWKMSSGHQGSDSFSRVAVFGGNEFTSVASSLRSGSVTTVVGGIVVDLRGARLDPNGAELDLTTRLGGIAVVVSPEWRVTLVNGKARGVVADVPDPENLADDAPELRVRVSTTLGGVTIGT